MAKSNINTQPAPMTAVLGGHHAPTALYEQVMAQVERRMPTMVEEQLYVLKDICGERFWDETLTSSWQRRMAGRCFAHMVAVGRFPVRFVQYKRYATKRYELK